MSMKSPILSEDEASTRENLTRKSRTKFNSTLPLVAANDMNVCFVEAGARYVRRYGLSRND